MRDSVYGDKVGEVGAHQISTGTLLALLALYIWTLERRWMLPDGRTALQVGAAWASFTVLFEFGFGHFVAGDSWSELFANYDLADGQMWVLVPLWMGLGPAIIRSLRVRRGR